MKILSFSSSFPSSVRKTEGTFVLSRLAAVARKVPLQVVHPVPTCPLLGRLVDRTSFPAEEQLSGLTVHHRRFAYVPRLLKRLDAYFYYRGLLGWLRRYYRRERPDILDGHFAWPDGVGVSYLAAAVRLPYTITLRGTINPRHAIRCFRRRMAVALRGASAVISVSQKMAELATELGVCAGRIHLVPNGVDGQAFRPVARSDARRMLGLDKSSPLIVCVAAVKRQKGHADLLEAVAQLPRNVNLIVVGSETGPGGYERQLSSLAAAKGLAGRATFVGGRPQAEVALYYSAADVSVLPSHSEGCPNVVLESLACGTPVVATRVGGVPEILHPWENGVIVPAQRPAELAEGLRAALARNWSRQSVRRSVVDRSWDLVADEVVEVFRFVLADHEWRPDLH